MCPGAMALAYANGELAAGSGDLQPQDGEIVEDGYIIVDQNTHEMRDGAKYKVKENVEIKPNGLGGRGIEIAEHANVTLNIEEGKTLTVTGRRSMDHRPGRAAIYLPQDSKLTVEGNGTLIAKGGDASPGEAGGKAQDSYVAIGEYLSVGPRGR